MNRPLDDRGLPPGYPLQPALELTPRQVKAGLDAGTIALIDCRTPEEHSAAHIAAATLIPLNDLAAKAGEIDALSDDATVVILCHHGHRSLTAALYLRHHGIEAMSMAGGIDLWSQDIDPTVPRY